MALSRGAIEAAAPDQGALTAAAALLKPAKWPLRARSGSLIWGECQGSGANPYRVAADVDDLGCKCTCPSRKFPCKHGLALMWMFVDGEAGCAAAPTPDWVTEWVGRRRKAAASPAAPAVGVAASRPKSLATAGAGPEAAAGAATVDPDAEVAGGRGVQGRPLAGRHPDRAGRVQGDRRRAAHGRSQPWRGHGLAVSGHRGQPRAQPPGRPPGPAVGGHDRRLTTAAAAPRPATGRRYIDRAAMAIDAAT
jgi:hypothetical protein